MLKQRVATAFILISIFLFIAFRLPTSWFAGLLGLVTLAAAQEWARLAGFEPGFARVLWLSVAAALLVLLWLRPVLLSAAILVGAAWWLFAAFKLRLSPASADTAAFKSVSGLMVLVPAWSALVYLHETSLALLLGLFAVVWLADTGAYFAGRRFGKRRLAPEISPGKTVEGVAGGIVLVMLFAAVSSTWYGPGAWCAVMWVASCIIASLFSVVGDLWESRMKRLAGVKDSGTLLPGHGGVLDRIDSVTAAAPVFAILVGVSAAQLGTCS